MNTLLRYLLFNVVIKIVLIEVAIMLFFVLLIALTKIYNRLRSRRINNRKKQIYEKFEQALFGPVVKNSRKEEIQNFKLPSNLCNFRDLIEVIESFDQRFTDQEWFLLKDKVIDEYLIQEANGAAFGRYWFPRQLAGRCYLLSPKKAPVDQLNHLLDDSRFLIRICAAICITKTAYKDLFRKMIGKMSQESDLAQFPYRDALMDADEEKYIWLQEILQQTQDERIINVCIDVLSTRAWHELPDLVEKYLYSEKQRTRILAIRALGSVPSDKSLMLLKKHLQDSDWEIRAESVISLGKLYVTSVANDLEPLLNDPSWWVRQQAAIALKNFGVRGKDILMRQSRESKPLAYEISQYILALP